MSSHVLVCPLNEFLINRLTGRRVALRADGIEAASRAIERGKRLGNDLQSILIRTELSLAAVPVDPEWRDVPIALYVSRLGRFPEFVRKLPELRQLNIRVYLSLDDAENYAGLRILSSLGVESAAVFSPVATDWNALGDLMTYALLARADRASIEPFRYIASNYDANRRTDYRSVYFEDPSRYLHLDDEGRVALSSQDLADESFIELDVDALGELDRCAAYVERLESWRTCFLATEGCAYCQGWRVCPGDLAGAADDGHGCTEFFVELMDAVEQYQSIQKQKRVVWQP